MKLSFWGYATIASSLTGAGLHILENIYIFHICLLFQLVFRGIYLLQTQRVTIYCKSFLAFWLINFFFIILDVLTAKNISVWFIVLTQVLMGAFVAIIAANMTADKNKTDKVFQVMCAVVIFCLFIGLLETTGQFRWYTSLLLERMEHADLARVPSSLFGNPNTFGFFVLLSMPFFLFHKNNAVKIFGGLVCIWLLLNIGSRAIFITLCLLPIFSMFYMSVTQARIIQLTRWLIPLFIFAVLVAGVLIDLVPDYQLARTLGSFDDMSKFLEGLMMGGGMDPGTSSGSRLQIYLAGLKAFVNSSGFGLGLGGTQGYLNDMGFRLLSVHFFFLELLIDLGIYRFLFIFFCFSVLIFKLWKVSGNKTAHSNYRYYTASSSCALLLSLPASIAPSGLYYFLPFYILIGFAVGLLVRRDN